MADIFIRRLFRKRGPYTEEEIRTWIREGKLSPRASAWREGMTGWKPLSEWGFLTAAASPRRRFQPAKRRNYDNLEAEEPGYGRMKFFLVSFVTYLLVYVILMAMSLYASHLSLAMPEFLKDIGIGSAANLGVNSLLHIVVNVCIGIWLTMQRLENIGWHWGWSILAVLPLIDNFIITSAGISPNVMYVLAGTILVELLFGFALIALPPGFAIYKKLDFIAWIWLAVLGIILALIAMVFSDPRFREAMEKVQADMRQFAAKMSSDDAPGPIDLQFESAGTPTNDAERVRELLKALTRDKLSLHNDYKTALGRTGFATLLKPDRIALDQDFRESYGILDRARKLSTPSKRGTRR